LSAKAWLALALFVVQNGCAGVILHSTQHSAGYSSQVAVLMQEFAVKLPICGFLYMIECGGPLSMVRSLVTDADVNRQEWLMMSVPALLYTVQNNCLYLGFLHLEAAVGQVTYQSKIFFTAICSVWMLGKQLSFVQWFSLVFLAAGVVFVQGADWFSGDAKRPKVPKKAHGGAANIQQVASLGVGAFLLAALCTSFASVYFEKMLKGSSKPSLWLRNIQLAAYSSIIAAAALRFTTDPKVATEGYFHGFSSSTWFSIVWQAGGGILVAVTIKYADNILRGFAQALAIIVASAGSAFYSDWKLTLPFSAGVVFVIAAVFLYGEACCTPKAVPKTAVSDDDESKAKQRLMQTEQGESEEESTQETRS